MTLKPFNDPFFEIPQTAALPVHSSSEVSELVEVPH